MYYVDNSNTVLTVFSLIMIGFRFSMIQLLVGKDKASNLLRAGKLIREAASKGAQVIALPVSSHGLN